MNSNVLSTPAGVRRASRATARRWRGLPELWHFASEYLLLLPFGAAIALVWANTYPESYFRTVFALDFFVTDVAMVLFFGLVMKEVVEATAHGGALHPWRRAALPVVAALGSAAVPAMLLQPLARFFGEPLVAQGWATAFAVDLAFAYFLAIVIFRRHPVLPLFIVVALSSNALGFAALAPAATARQFQPATLLVLMTAALGVAFVLRRRGTRSFWPYVIAGGGLSWAALVFGGIHPALALVPIVPFMPRAAHDPGFLVDAPAAAHDTLNEFERWSRHPAQVALLLFGLVTGGVLLRALDAGTLAMPVAVFAGKPAGFFLGVALALALGLHLPFHVGWRELVVVGFLTTIGFTMALFFATVAIGPGAVLSELKMGGLITLAGGLMAIAAARVLHVGRFARPGERPGRHQAVRA
jgi:Na+:H+ antiporter, NhaA family